MELGIRIFSSVMAPLIMLLGLTYFVITDKYVQKTYKRTLLVALVIVGTLVASDILDYYLTNHYSDPTLRLINCTYGYIIYPILIVIFYYFVGGRSSYRLGWILVGVNTAVYVASLFTSVAYTIDENNVFVRGPLGFTSHAVSVILLINLLVMTCRKYKGRARYYTVPLICLGLLLGAMLLDVAIPGIDQFHLSFVTLAIIISCVFFYIWIHLQLAEQYEERLLSQHQMRIMVSQIQPHFLYNTIATFRALCKRDPDKAAMVAEKFGLYLRENLDSLSDEDLIPVEKELDHTRVYAEIEMVRFKNIRVEYDIRDVDFELPALTIQPIVENAIRHGVRIREEGIVRVSTRQSDGFHEIAISDNGIGFDTAEAYSDDGSHIGINNVRERIEKMCAGTMTVESEIDKGTTVTIRIPKTEMKQ